MEKSYEEIHRILARMNVQKENFVFKGSDRYLPADKTPVMSPAAEDLVKKARACTTEEPLYVLAIGAITNVASALLMAPDIVDKIVIVWLGGHALHWPDTKEFNLIQDVPAAQVVFDCGAAVVQLPCMGVVDHMLTTLPEVNTFIKGRGSHRRFSGPAVFGMQRRSFCLFPRDLGPHGHRMAGMPGRGGNPVASQPHCYAGRYL